MAKFEDVYRKMVQEQANPEAAETEVISEEVIACLLYTSPSPRD